VLSASSSEANLSVCVILNYVRFSIVQDYAIIQSGSLTFKITRLLLIALLAVHTCACIFWKVKISTASPEDVELFLSSRSIDHNVRSSLD
jgi:hypothetical protein